MKTTTLLRVGIVAIVLLLVVISVHKVIGGPAWNHTKSQSSISKVHDEAALIDQNNNLFVKVLNSSKYRNEMTQGAGQLLGYYAGDKIVKIIERYGLSYGLVTFTYYFSNDELMLVHETEEGFIDMQNVADKDYSNVELVFESYYYFARGDLIQTVETGSRSVSTEFSRNPDWFMAVANENIKILQEN